MTSTVRILFPVFLIDQKEAYFRGFISFAEENAITIYIIREVSKDEINNINLQKLDNTVYGCCGDIISKRRRNRIPNLLLIDRNDKLNVNMLIVNGTQMESKSNCIIMLYDYHSVRASQTINESSDYFSKLQTLLKCEYGESTGVTSSINEIQTPNWLSSSMFLQHLFNYWKLINWLISTLRRDRKISVKHGNFILSIIMDIILGYFLLQLFSQDKKDISTHLMGILEKLINLLNSLLKWLMGAPVGLKLNNAFNKMLGKYFSYHVQLWWLFLDVSSEKLDTILHIYNYMGYLGFTFQTAVIADMICIATFHSYCIYVYAARLFNIQISGLIALLRLFVGRKYNPLRGGIDSCEYTNQELFVGTVAFTILLLLLPTTALYYIVFTLFRILSITVQYSLAKFIYLIQVLPLYVVSLWLTKSPKVAGNILLEVVSKEENSPLVLRVKLFSKSVQELVTIFQPPVEVPRQVEWTNLLSNVLVGKQIV